MDANSLQSMLMEYSTLLGTVLPAIQNQLNKLITKDLRVFGKIITVKYQKVMATYALSAIPAVVVAGVTANWDWVELLKSSAEIFALSQVAYYTFFRKEDKK